MLEIDTNFEWQSHVKVAEFMQTAQFSIKIQVLLLGKT